MANGSTEEQQIKNRMNLNYNLEPMQKIIDKVKKFQVRDSDIFLLGYPKSGTSWACEMVWLIGNDLDYEGAKVWLGERYPILEGTGYDLALCDPNFKHSERYSDSIKFTEDKKNPRFIKIHLTGENLPEQILTSEKKPKIIYVVRNVKDVCLSSYHYQKNILNLVDGSISEYSDVFMDKGIFAVGNYWENVLYFWQRRNEDHILIIEYEEMLNDLPTVVQKVAKHLNKTLTKEQEIKLVQWLDIESIKKNSAMNGEHLYKKAGFIRVGKAGEHKKEMTPELISKFNTWSKHCIKDTDFTLNNNNNVNLI